VREQAEAVLFYTLWFLWALLAAVGLSGCGIEGVATSQVTACSVSCGPGRMARVTYSECRCVELPDGGRP
jgi:hypothetical protein